MSRAEETETAAEVTRAITTAESLLQHALANLTTHPNQAAQHIHAAIRTIHSIRGFLL